MTILGPTLLVGMVLLIIAAAVFVGIALWQVIKKGPGR